MIIQFNTGHNIPATQELQQKFTDLISVELERFSSMITRIEVHLTDVDGKKDGFNDKRCLLEARLEKRQPIAVKNMGNTHEEAVTGAIDKLKSALDTITGRLKEH